MRFTFDYEIPTTLSVQILHISASAYPRLGAFDVAVAFLGFGLSLMVDTR